MTGQAARFPALHAEEINLIVGVGVTTSRKRDRLAIGRPARARFAAVAKRQLHLAGAITGNAIDVTDAAISFPISAIDGEEELPAIGRQLRIAQQLLFECVHKGAATLAFRRLS